MAVVLGRNAFSGRLLRAADDKIERSTARPARVAKPLTVAVGAPEEDPLVTVGKQFWESVPEEIFLTIAAAYKRSIHHHYLANKNNRFLSFFRLAFAAPLPASSSPFDYLYHEILSIVLNKTTRLPKQQCERCREALSQTQQLDLLSTHQLKDLLFQQSPLSRAYCDRNVLFGNTAKRYFQLVVQKTLTNSLATSSARRKSKSAHERILDIGALYAPHGRRAIQFGNEDWRLPPEDHLQAMAQAQFGDCRRCVMPASYVAELALFLIFKGVSQLFASGQGYQDLLERFMRTEVECWQNALRTYGPVLRGRAAQRLDTIGTLADHGLTIAVEEVPTHLQPLLYFIGLSSPRGIYAEERQEALIGLNLDLCFIKAKGGKGAQETDLSGPVYYLRYPLVIQLAAKTLANLQKRIKEDQFREARTYTEFWSKIIYNIPSRQTVVAGAQRLASVVVRDCQEFSLPRLDKRQLTKLERIAEQRLRERCQALLLSAIQSPDVPYKAKQWLLENCSEASVIPVLLEGPNGAKALFLQGPIGAKELPSQSATSVNKKAPFPLLLLHLALAVQSQSATSVNKKAPSQKSKAVRKLLASCSAVHTQPQQGAPAISDILNSLINGDIVFGRWDSETLFTALVWLPGKGVRLVRYGKRQRALGSGSIRTVLANLGVGATKERQQDVAQRWRKLWSLGSPIN